MSASSDKARPKRWRRIDPAVIFAVHDRQLAEHGGSEGIRDAAGIESAFVRPMHVVHYGEPDAAGLAACAYGIVKNHGVVDGNKRTAWIAARPFLADNGHRLRLDWSDRPRTMPGAVGNAINEGVLAHRFHGRLDADE
ncbi:MAG: Fic family protein [Boseongicola sp.]|nr:Fic family protein [Boseongicola sp.]